MGHTILIRFPVPIGAAGDVLGLALLLACALEHLLEELELRGCESRVQGYDKPEKLFVHRGLSLGCGNGLRG